MKERTSVGVRLTEGVSTKVVSCLLLISLVHSFALSLVAQTNPRTDGTGPAGRYYPVHDFRDDFQVYDEGAGAYVPYLPEQHADQPALSAYVDLESNRHYKLLVTAGRGGFLFINAALKRRLAAGQWQVLDIDSLYRAYRQPELFLTLYGAPGLADKQLLIGYPKSATEKPVVLRDDNLSVRPRPASAYPNFLSAGLLFLLATHAFLYVFYRRAFERFYNLRDLLSVRAGEESFLINRPLSGTNLLFTLNLGLVLAYLILFAQSQHPDAFTTSALPAADQRFGSLLLTYGLLSLLSFGALVGKYVALEVLGGLYKLQSVTDLHYFKVLQSSLVFFTTLTLLSVAAANGAGLVWSPGMLLGVLVTFYVARLGLLYVVIRHAEPIKNLYLFSYLCIVELIPLIVGLRYAL